ncbi:MAG: tRNA 2-thiouridine(34) synthase MnmA [Bacillota bacterium]|nr:tRNA 2-thiouridine(34) synthase MnmA [Bacillota bacterium]
MSAKVLLGMSGGVDSSVAAHVLQEQGYEVIGATMRLWIQDDSPDAGGCCSLSSIEDARFVAQRLGIPHYVLNYKEIFRQHVVEYFIAEYKAGRTPNPCIACNSRVRFTQFLEQARSLGCDYIATGHYARVEQTPQGARLRKSVDSHKDQTYMLFRMTETQLARTLFPLGSMTKPEVRKLAASLDLVVAEKPDSQEICFVQDDDYKGFLRSEGALDTPGDIVSSKGILLGKHRGIFDYTIGQRKGLGLTSPTPLYVLEIDAKRNRIVVGAGEELFKHRVEISELHFLDRPQPEEEITGKARYTTADQPCRVEFLGNDRAVVSFAEPVRAPTPGQSLVLYKGDLVVGGGTIT